MDDKRITGSKSYYEGSPLFSMKENDAENDLFSDLIGGRMERLAHVTKSLDDLDVITKLMDEKKESDLEFVAKIGQSLLEQNENLRLTNEVLEEKLSSATDQVTQLKHDLQKKIDQLHFYTDCESTDSGESTPANERVSNLGFLQRKLRLLEEENAALKLEAGHLKALTQELEEKEQLLLTDCHKKIGSANAQIEATNTKLLETQEQCENQRKQLVQLQKNVMEKRTAEKKMRYENEELALRLRATQETQSELAQELLDLQERYAEVVAMLAESNDELKQLRETTSGKRFYSITGDFPCDSLASELEASDSGYSTNNDVGRCYGGAMSRQREEKLISVMESAHAALTKEKLNDQTKNGTENMSTLTCDVPSVPGVDAHLPLSPSRDNEQPTFPNLKSTAPELELSTVGGGISRVPSNESLCGYPGPGVGVPGIPGTKDLEFAIRRLSLRRRVEIEFARYQSERMVQSRKATGNPLDTAVATSTTTYSNQHSSIPARIRSRLMWVKSVDGSGTMAHWKELATPSGFSASTLEKRQGIKVRGGNGSPPSAANILETDRRTPKLDFPAFDRLCPSSVAAVCVTESQSSKTPLSSNLSSRQLVGTPCTFSFVNSQVLHPNDGRRGAVSVLSLNMIPSVGSSRIPSTSSQDDGTSTFSTALNLAQALGERCAGLFSGIGTSLWVTRQSPMTVPAFSLEAPSLSTIGEDVGQLHSRVTQTGLESLLEKDNGGFNAANETLPKSGIGILSRTSLNPSR